MRGRALGRRRASRSVGRKGRPTGRGSRSASHRDGRPSSLGVPPLEHGTDAPAGLRADVQVRAQSVRQVLPTAVCLDVHEATELGDATEVDSVARRLHGATEVDCAVDCVCGSLATEVDSEGPVCGTTEVDRPAATLHVSPTTEVECGVDSRGLSRRGEIVPIAAGAAWWETHPPPRRARHQADRADVRPHLGSAPEEMRVPEGSRLIDQGSEGFSGEIRDTASGTGPEASEDGSRPLPASPPVTDQPIDGSRGLRASAEGDSCGEPSLGSSLSVLASCASAGEGPPVDDLASLVTPGPACGGW